MAATASTHDIWAQRLGFWYLAEDHPDALAVAESPEGAVTYAELAALAHQTVHALRSRGVPDGATVAVLAPNGILPIQVALACQQAGWCLLLVNGYVTASEVIDILEHSGASVLVLHQQHQNLLDGEGGERITRLCEVLGVGDVPGAASLEVLLAEQPACCSRPPSSGKHDCVLLWDDGRTQGNLATPRR